MKWFQFNQNAIFVAVMIADSCTENVEDTFFENEAPSIKYYFYSVCAWVIQLHVKLFNSTSRWHSNERCDRSSLQKSQLATSWYLVPRFRVRRNLCMRSTILECALWFKTIVYSYNVDYNHRKSCNLWFFWIKYDKSFVFLRQKLHKNAIDF